MKAIGGYGFGYGYLEKANTKARTNVTASIGTVRTHFLESDSQILYASQGLAATNRNLNDLVQSNHQHNSVPRKNQSGRYIENYAPPPSQFVHEFAAAAAAAVTTTTTTTSFTKSTDNLLDTYNASNASINSTCECKPVNETHVKILKHKQQSKECLGYYSNLPKATGICSKTMTLPSSSSAAMTSKTKNSAGNGELVKPTAENVSIAVEITRLQMPMICRIVIDIVLSISDFCTTRFINRPPSTNQSIAIPMTRSEQ